MAMRVFKRMALPVLFLVEALMVSAQCDKKLSLVTDKVYQVKTDNSIGDELPVAGVIRLFKDSIFVSMNWQSGETTNVRGSNAEIKCKMNSNYQDGTIDIKSDAEITAHGQTSKAKMLFNIISKEGRIKVYAVPENNDEKICFAIREWQEIK
jgi:hypothetical protein